MKQACFLFTSQRNRNRTIGLCPGWRASHCLRATLGARLDGATRRSWGASLPNQGMLSVANTHTFISSEEVRAVPAAHGLLAGMQLGGSSSPELRLCRCKRVRRRCSSQLTSPHPKYTACWASFLYFHWLLQVVCKGLFFANTGLLVNMHQNFSF